MNKVCSLLVIILICTFSPLAQGDELTSPFPAFSGELNIPNSDEVGHTGRIFRGMAPGNSIAELAQQKFSDVLIFKRQTRTEVDEERAALLSLGFKPERIHHIAFNWKQYRSLTLACEQTLDALRLLVEIKNSPQRKIYFHCTMGEDRTGHLAGLFRILTEKKSHKEIYQEELCAHGFAEGNKQKPADIVGFVNGELKTLFLVIAEKIEQGQITEKKIDKTVCKNLTTTYVSQNYSCTQ